MGLYSPIKANVYFGGNSCSNHSGFCAAAGTPVAVEVMVNESVPLDMFGKVYLESFDPINPVMRTPYQNEPEDDDGNKPDDNNGNATLSETILTFDAGQQNKTVQFNFATAQPGDNYIVAVHPNTGIVDDIYTFEKWAQWNASNYQGIIGGTLLYKVPGDFGDCTLLPENLQTQMLTVWRTLWMELDRMAAPVLPTAPGQVSDGFAFDTKYATSLVDSNGNPIKDIWDTQHHVDTNGHEPDDFDLVSIDGNGVPLPLAFPDTSLLIQALQLACIDAVVVDIAKLASWNLNYQQPTVPFQRNLTRYDMAVERRILCVRNDISFWNIYVLGAFDPPMLDGDNPPNDLWALGGWASAMGDGVVLIFNEAKRDQFYHIKKRGDNPREISELLQGVVIHEALHLFGFDDVPGEYDPNNSMHVENGVVMSRSYFDARTPDTWKDTWKTFNDKQIRKIQARANPQ